MQRFSTLLSLSMLTALASAQVGASYHPANVPGGSCPSQLVPGMPQVPRSVRFQVRIPASQLGGTVREITDLGFYAAASAWSARDELTFTELSVRAVQNPAAALTTRFDQNLGTHPVTLLERSNYIWRPEPNTWNGLALDSSFVLDPSRGALVLDFVIRGMSLTSPIGSPINPGGMFHSSHALERLVSSSFGTNSPAPVSGTLDHHAHDLMLSYGQALTSIRGRGCGASSVPDIAVQGTPYPGAGVSVSLTNGTPSAMVALLVGTQSFTFDLSSLGAPGCTAHVLPEALIPMSLDGRGHTTLRMSIPAAAHALGRRVFTQFAIVDPAANTLGLAVSPYVTWSIGSRP